ncbi:MAG TPA: hypothetical protein VFU97_11070 [Xanthobacteraceae bacterium]|jgi:hypothetical protein|nr:hypothetical protein [Xanthobacteraceae bacterium]
MNSKFALSALGLAMLIATPAFAQKPAHRAAPAPYASATAPMADGQFVVGTDPDPSIRFELLRDSSTYTTSN